MALKKLWAGLSKSFCMNLPVIPKEDLIEYRNRLNRDEDKEDLGYLKT